jgi:hypothetical protein
VNTLLPTANELGRLPVRAIVAYAARTARRVSAEFRGEVADEIIDDALRLIDSVSTKLIIVDIDRVALIRASERVVAAYQAVSDTTAIPKVRLLFSFVQAALAAMYAVDAAATPHDATRRVMRVAHAAERAVRPIGSLKGEAANAAQKAARHDYDVLLRTYGEHEQIVIGEPIDCFENE